MLRLQAHRVVLVSVAPVAVVLGLLATEVRATSWQSLGPEGGAVHSLLADPTDESTIWAGTNGGAVYVSRNRGETWSVAADGFRAGRVLDLQRQPFLGEPIYAVTHSAVFRLEQEFWMPLQLPEGDRWSRFTVDPLTPGRVWAITRGPTFDQDGLLRSEDRGLTWTRVTTQFFSPTSPLVVLPTSPPTLLTAFGARMQRSVDGGVSWTESQIANDWVPYPSSFEVDPHDLGTVYAVAGPLQLDPPTLLGLRVLRSVDAGVTWEDASAGLPSVSQYLNHDLEVDPTNPQRLYLSIATEGVFVSRNGGASWNAYDGFEASSLDDFRPVQLEYSSGGSWAWAALPFESSQPLARAPGPGAFWSLLERFADGSTIDQVTTHPTAEGEWLLRLGDGRVALTTDAGDSWTFAKAGLEGRRPIVLARDPHVAGAVLLVSETIANPAGAPYQVHRSEDGGRSWSVVQSDLPWRAGYLVADPFVDGRWYSLRGFFALMVSTDGGVTWSEQESPCGGPAEIAPSPHAAGTLLIGCVRDSGIPVSPPIHHGDIWRTTDGGASWSEVQPVIVDRIYRDGWSIAWDGDDPDTVLAGLAGTSGGTLLLRSADGGASFDDETPEPAFSPVTHVATSRRDGGELLGTVDDGAWHRHSDGSWTPLREGLTSQSVVEVAFDPLRPGRVLAGTSGGGLHRIEDVRPEPCETTASKACLRDRFSVEVLWFGDDAAAAPSSAVELEDGTAGFWWFDIDNLELAVKIVDGRTINGHWWLFVGALTDRRYQVVVEDLDTGTRKVWDGRLGQQQSIADVEAFADPPATGGPDPVPATVAAAGRPDPVSASSFGARGTSLALGPYRLELRRQVGGSIEHATPRAVNANSGAFWWFEPSSLDLFVKVLDGRAINGRWWLYVGSLTDVAFELVVTHTETGAVRRYQNPQGAFAGFADIELPE